MDKASSSIPTQDNATETTTSVNPTSRTSSRKLWLIFGAVVIALLIALVVVGILLFQKSGTKEESVPEVSEILKYMNLTIDPCQDFYNFSCGGWHEWDSVKNAQEEMSFSITVRNASDKQILELLTQKTKEGDPVFETQPREFFAACNNMDRLKERGVLPFLELARKIGKFPILDSSWTEHDFNLQNLLTKTALLGTPSFFNASLFQLDYAGNITITIFTHLVYETHSKDEYDSTKKILEMLGVNTMSPQSEADITDIFKIYEELYSLYTVSFYPWSYITISELHNNVRWLDWQRFFHDISAEALGVQNAVKPDDKLLIDSIGFLSFIKDQIFDKFSKRAVANYIFYSMLSLTTNLEQRFTIISFEDQSDVTVKGRLQRCLSEVKFYFPDQISRMYYDRFYSQTDSVQIKNIINDIKVAFMEIIKKADWLTETAKAKALYKLIQIQEKYNTKEHWRDDGFLNDMYKEVPTDEYFEAVVALNRALFNKYYKIIRDRQDPWNNRESWLWQEFDMAFEYPELNHETYMAIPPNFLKMPGIKSMFTSSTQYGAMGTFLAHMITHTLLEDYWNEKDWLLTVKDVYMEIINCFNSQLKNTSRTQKQYWYQLTWTYNYEGSMADTQGLQASFLAYQIFRRRKEEKFLEPGINLNHDQLFFVGFAQTLCQKVPRSNRDVDKIEGYTPSLIRVLMSMTNSNEFAEVFNCSKGRPLNPEKKCKFL